MLGLTIVSFQALGYNGEVGYQTFLYSNAGDIRRIFMFLIEKLPREAEKVSVEPDGNEKKFVMQLVRIKFWCGLDGVCTLRFAYKFIL